MEPIGAELQHAALRRAYALVEAAQGLDVMAEIKRLDAEARELGWEDVRCVLQFAWSLAVRETGLDDAEELQAMLVTAEAHGDQALLALALAATALRRADAGQVLAAADSGTNPLVRAVALLDGAASLAIHRAAAHIDVAGSFHAMGLWELALDHSDLAEAALNTEESDVWAEVVHRQRRVIAANRVETVLDWACALAEVDAWDSAAALARGMGAHAIGILDADWPECWVAQQHAYGHLLAALAGEPSVADLNLVAAQASAARTHTALAVATFADAVRATRAGQPDRAAALAISCAGRMGPPAPPQARLLAMNLAGYRSDEPGPALAYARELAGLRWNTRLDRLATMRVSIDTERRRLEHEQLKREALIDDLTGLANRRAYNGYLEALRHSPGALDPQEQPTDVAVMMLDVDLFKGINDTFGHDVGDQVLRRIGAVLAAQVRTTDLAARLGGDEFVVVLSDAPAGLPEARAQQILETIRDQAWDELAPGLTVSASLGLRHGHAGHLSALLSEADQHLYRAKRGGRGRVASGPQA